MTRPDPRPFTFPPSEGVGSASFDEHEFRPDDDGEVNGDLLVRLFSAVTLAVVALAAASLVLV